MKKIILSILSLIVWLVVIQAQPTLYGLTREGGTASFGTIVKYQGATNTLSVVKSFESLEYKPLGSFILAFDGKLYGMTSIGGSSNNGVIFSFDPATGIYSVVKNFDGGGGANPQGSLMQASDGKLYGMTLKGGSNNLGVIFSFDAVTGSYTVVKNFDNISGFNPYGSLIQASDGKLYGMTSAGGDPYTRSRSGVIFSLDPATRGYTVLKTFFSYDGYFPQGSLVQASDGKLYGMTVYGGSIGGNIYSGVIFSFDPVTNGYSVVKHFGGSSGYNPQGSLIQATDGKLYGMTSGGGTGVTGVIFSLDPATSNYSVVANLNDYGLKWPYGSLVQASDGKLYGMTSTGGAIIDYYYGGIFSLDLTSGIFGVVKTFDPLSGAFPQGSLVQASDGKLYGMTSRGGSADGGVAFSLTTSSNYTVLKNFGTNKSGTNASPGLLKATDGKLYGTTSLGGSNGKGVVFSLDPASDSYSVVKTFGNGSGEGYPTSSLVQASDGKLYGSGSDGRGNGVIFSLTTSGSYTVIKTFDNLREGNPEGGLVQASDGKLYGITSNGSGNGVIFSLTTSGIYAVVNTFYDRFGANPYGSLIQASDDKLYGMISGAINYNGYTYGGIFSLDPATNSYTVVKTFDNTSGANPQGSLMQAFDGKLYGMTYEGGSSNQGVIFSFDPATGIYGVVKNLDASIGANPKGSLIQVSDCKLYGTAMLGRPDRTNMVIFSLDPASGSYTVEKNFDISSGGPQKGDVLVELGHVAPVVITKPVTVSLDANGNGSITASQIDNGSNAPCGIKSIVASKTTFTCADFGPNNVTLTVTDIHDNVSTGIAIVTIEDHIAPVVITKSVTVTLDVNGNASITAASVNNGSNDACGIAGMSVSPSVFHCINIGDNMVTLTVTDIHNNVSTKTAVVTVVGEIPTSAITSVPTDNTFTGGNPLNLYLGYGAQSTTLKVITPASGIPYTYLWSGASVSMLSSITSVSPVFTPTIAGVYTFTVTATNKYGCQAISSITLCVKDIRVAGTNGSKVYICQQQGGSTPNTLSISVNAVSSHLAHHANDKLGMCDQNCGTLGIAARSQTPELFARDLKGNVPSMRITPVPNKGLFNIQLLNYPAGKAQIRIMDINSKIIAIRSIEIGKVNTFYFNLMNKAAGTYIITVHGQKNVLSGKLIIQ